ncbi:MAG TPA: PDZ domain-containing protein [Bryobacteraceae bacterium]|nr:PDZ domain-containing protein [Bryobacteraceae bacterium]
MRTLGIGTVLLAASLLTPAAFAQNASTRSIVVSTNPGYLGIGSRDIDPDRAKALKLPEVRGAEITNVIEDSPAAKAGFKEGDVILEFNGQRVEGIDQLTRMVSETPAGRQVKITVWRNGATMTLTPTLDSNTHLNRFGGNVWAIPDMRMPEITIPPMPPVEIPRFSMSYQNPMLGITGESLGQEEQFADFFGVKDGVLVKSVAKDSAAEKAGIKAGDVIVKIDDAKVTSTREITSALRSARTKKTVTVTVVRNKKEMPITVTVESVGASGVRALWIGPMQFETPSLVVSTPSIWVVSTPKLKPIVYKPKWVRPRWVFEFPAQNRVI